MKSLGIFSILIGVYINDALFIHLFTSVFAITITFLVGLIGLIFAFISWKISNKKGYRYLSSIGLLLNGLPILIYLYLYMIL